VSDTFIFSNPRGTQGKRSEMFTWGHMEIRCARCLTSHLAPFLEVDQIKKTPTRRIYSTYCQISPKPDNESAASNPSVRRSTSPIAWNIADFYWGWLQGVV